MKKKNYPKASVDVIEFRAEKGFAAHWKYKLGYKDKEADKKLEKGIGWVKHLHKQDFHSNLFLQNTSYVAYT